MLKLLNKSKPKAPVRLVVVNCMSAGRVPVKKSEQLLHTASLYADILLGDECFNMVAADVLPDFHVSQAGKTGSSAASTVVAVRKTRGKIIRTNLISGAPASKDTDVRERYWLKCMVKIDKMRPRKFTSGHAEPKRAWDLWNRYMLQAPGGTLGLDTNKLRRAIVVRFPFRKVRQVGLLAAIIPRRIPCSRVTSDDIGGDHKLVRVTMWPKV